MNKVEMNRCFAGAQKPPAAGRGVVALLLLFSALSAGAVTDTATGLLYEEASGEATVTGYTGAGGDVAIPATLGGFPCVAIGTEAFLINGTITSVTIPDSVQVIGSSAFFRCSALESVELGTGVTNIGTRAFSECPALASITIPDSVRSIGDWAFRHCDALASITIPDSVTTIGNSVFGSCFALASVELGTGVTNISAGMFDSCSALASITIPDSVRSIGDWAFRHCDTLASITIPDSVTTIGNSAFGSCFALASVELGTGVTNISAGMFDSCSALASITIPDSVQSIGNQAFFDCVNLASITIPDGVQSIGDEAFFDCSALEAVYFEGDAPSLGSEVFSFTDVTIYYLSGTSGWGPTFGGRPTAIGRAVPQILGAAAWISVNAGAVDIRWTAATGASHQVQYTTNLASAGWTALGDTAAADTGERSMTDSVAADPARFYRVLATTAENPIQNLIARTRGLNTEFRFGTINGEDARWVLLWSGDRVTPGHDIGLTALFQDRTEDTNPEFANITDSKHFAVVRLSPQGGVWRVRVDLVRSAAGAGKEFRFLYGASDGKLREHATEYDAWAATTTDTAVWCMPASTTESLRIGNSELGKGDRSGDRRGGTAPAGTHIGFTLQGEPAWIERLSVRLTRLSD